MWSGCRSLHAKQTVSGQAAHLQEPQLAFENSVRDLGVDPNQTLHVTSNGVCSHEIAVLDFSRIVVPELIVVWRNRDTEPRPGTRSQYLG
jgi:hypothetical protein